MKIRLYCCYTLKTFESILTNLSEGGDEDPEGDDEWDLNPLELDVENVVLWGASMTMAVAIRSIVTEIPALDRVLIKHFLMTTQLIIRLTSIEVTRLIQPKESKG